MKRLFAFVIAGFMSQSLMAAEVAPDALVKQVSQDVLGVLKKDKDIQNGNRKKIFDLVETKVLPHFDFSRMTQLAVGKNWRTATPDQQKQLTDEFRSLLVRTYSLSLANYKNQTVDYRPLVAQPGDTDVTVKTLIIQPGGDSIPVDYSMRKGSDGWKVYDIAIANASLVTTYRGQFNNEIRQSGIDGLIKKLADKNNADDSGKSKKL
jgi:ABC-type transport system involved in resistance to organic solvents, auxiliary component